MSPQSIRGPSAPESIPAVVHVIHSLEGGGTERMLLALVHAFDPSLMRHTVVTLREPGAPAERLPDHVACRPLAFSGRRRTAGLALARILRRQHAQIVHARGIGCWWDTILASLLAPGVRPILGFHGLESGGSFNGWQRRLARFGLWTGAEFATVSYSGRDQLRDEAAIPESHIHVMPNGVDLERFANLPKGVREQSRRALRISEHEFVVGTVGSLTPVKRHDLLIRAAAKAAGAIPNLRLVIVGDGRLREELEQLARSEGLAERVTLTGLREDVPALLKAMDVYVCSSDSEGMSNALLEAMAAGLPIIATDVGDNARLLDNGQSGLIVPPGSSGTLTDALAVLDKAPNLRPELRSAVSSQIGLYDLRCRLGQYEEVYGRLSFLAHEGINAELEKVVKN